MVLDITALVASFGVLFHDGSSEAVATGTMLGEGFFFEREHPAKPRDVLSHGQGGAELEAIGDNGLEFEALLVHNAIGVDEPLPECESGDVVE